MLVMPLSTTAASKALWSVMSPSMMLTLANSASSMISFEAMGVAGEVVGVDGGAFGDEAFGGPGADAAEGAGDEKFFVSHVLLP